jgi:nucleoid DNA-binding protein
LSKIVPKTNNSSPLTRSELIPELAAANTQFRGEDVETIVATIFDGIAAALTRRDRVEPRGFGAFTVRRRMDTLAKTVDQSCHLTVLSGPRQLVVAQVDTPGGMGLNVKIGATIDLLKSASGRVLLAFQDKEEACRLISLVEPQSSVAEQKTFMKTIAKAATPGLRGTVKLGCLRVGG